MTDNPFSAGGKGNCTLDELVVEVSNHSRFLVRLMSLLYEKRLFTRDELDKMVKEATS